MDKFKDMIFISGDGDSIGRLVGRAVLSDDPEKLRDVSERIERAQSITKAWIKEKGGILVSSGGDEFVAAIPKELESKVEGLRKDIEYSCGYTVSVGIGNKMAESGQALLLSKLHGKNRIEKYNEKAKKEIEEIKKRVKKGKFKNMQEYKIGEQYLDKSEKLSKAGDDGRAAGVAKELHEVVEKPDEPSGDECEYCNQTDGVDPDHCKYCHDEEPAEGEESCRYCKELNPFEGKPEAVTEKCKYCDDAEPKEGEKECQYCGYDKPVDEALDFPELADQDNQFGKEKDRYQVEDNNGKGPVPPLTSPDSNNSVPLPGTKEERDLYEGMGMNPPQASKPPPPDERPPIGQGPTSEVQIVQENDAPNADTAPDQRLDDQRDVPKEGQPAIDPEDIHSKEAMIQIAQAIEEGDKPNGSNRDKMGAENIPSGSNMEDNISRPDGFEQNTPGDTGEKGENQVVPEYDEPDMKSLLEEGLDYHAESIGKEKAIRSISQALEEFKAAKQSLEQSKEQMPQLYQASLGILKAMIDMAGMLGLGQTETGMGQESGQTQELGQEQQELTPELPEQPEQFQQDDGWHNPFPTHPDQGGVEKPSHDKTSPNKPGQDDIIGQGIKKLPTSRTTPHITRNPLPIGGVNALGQQKVMDNQGKIRFINRKQGMVQGSSGVPVKPTKSPQG